MLNWILNCKVGIDFILLVFSRNVLVGDTLLGCWATVGVLTEKGNPKTSSVGKSYCIWKIGCLDENTISLFLFGDAYEKHYKEQAGTVFALFNCAVRKDNAVSTCHILVALRACFWCGSWKRFMVFLFFVAGKRFFLECVFFQSTIEDRYFCWLWSLQGKKERWNGLYAGNKQVCYGTYKITLLSRCDLNSVWPRKI